jgi:hypothetical protein
MVKIPKYFPKRFSRPTAIILILILGLYALNWVVYGLEYSKGRSAVLKHYSGIAQAYTCGGVGVPEASTFKLRPRLYIIPGAGVSYEISAANDGTAEGYVVPFGKVVETSPPQACLSQ